MKKLLRIFVVLVLCYTNLQVVMANATGEGIGKLHPRLNGVSNLFAIPDAPTNLVVTPINTGGMIQFTAPTSDGGSPITNYEYSIDNGSTWVTPSPAITSSPLIISSGLTNCTSYQVKIRAVNAVGSGTESAAVQLIPAASVDMGVNWTERTSAADNNWQSVAYGNGLFVAVAGSGIGNRVMTSPDGVTWTIRTSAADNNWQSVAYGNGLFVAVAVTNNGSVNRVMTSENGIIWTIRTFSGNPIYSVTYGNGLFVAVANNTQTTNVLTSTDGITWTYNNTTQRLSSSVVTSVTYGNGLFVAVTNNGSGNRVRTSPDGITWTARTSAANNNWQSVAYGNGLFVAVAGSGIGNRVMTSPDGVTWTIRSSAADNDWRSVTYGNGLFVAVAISGTGNRVMTSPDGITWTSRTSAADNSWTSVTYGNGLFVAVASSGTGNRVMTSSFSVVANAPVVTSATFGNSTTVSFTQSASALSSSISNYEYSTDNGSNWVAVSPAATTSPLTITGLATIPSSIMIRAVNSVGSSCPSNNFLPPTPPTAAAQTFCGSKTIADLVATGTDLKWYDVATNGTALASTTAITTGTYYVTQTLNNNESARTSVAVTVNTTSPPTASAQTFIGSKTIADLVATGTNLKWYDVATNGTALSSTTAIATGTYYVSQTLNSCESYRTSVSVSVTPITLPGTPTNLVATGINTGGMIQFTAPASDGGSAITNYEYSTDNGATWVTPSPAVTSSPLIISSGLTNCTSYQVKIRAVNAVGSGTASIAATLVPSTSNIGVNWTSRTSAADNLWYSVAYGNGIFVAVSNDGGTSQVMTSPDGVTWTARTSAADNPWSSVTYGNGVFVAVAFTGTGNGVMTSPDGITWTAQTPAADNPWTSVTYGNGLFVAVAYTGSVMTSPDGVTWTARTSAADNPWSSVTYGNGVFVAVAFTGTGNRVMSSPDGITWTSRNAAAENEWVSVTYGNGLFVAVAIDGTGNRVMSSPDGITWTSRNAAAENQWVSVTYGNGLFVAVAIDGTGNGVMTSPDGIKWTARTSAADNFWISVTYGNGLFVAVAPFDVDRVMTSGYSVVADAPVITTAPVSQSEATVSFTQSTPALAPAITNYRYSIDNGSNWTTLSPASTTSPITITGLTDFSNQIQLQAINSVGNSCPASYSLSLVAVNLNKSGQKSSSPSEFVNKNGARGISGIRATGESRTNTPLLSATAAVTSITATTATSGGTVGADGGASVTARGVCWSTTTNPTITNSKTTDGTGIGTFTSAITGLTSGTTYYVRSYATNSVGTTYGPEVIFTTL